MRVSHPKIRSALVEALVSFYCKPPELGELLQVSPAVIGCRLETNFQLKIEKNMECVVTQ